MPSLLRSTMWETKTSHPKSISLAYGNLIIQRNCRPLQTGMAVKSCPLFKTKKLTYLSALVNRGCKQGMQTGFSICYSPHLCQRDEIGGPTPAWLRYRGPRWGSLGHFSWLTRRPLPSRHLLPTFPATASLLHSPGCPFGEL